MSNNYSLRFKRIDNQVKIVLNNAVVWDSGVIHNNPSLNKIVDLNSFFQAGSNTIRVDLYNAVSNQYNPWSISYEILKNGSVIGSVETGDADDHGPGNTGGGIAFSRDHTFLV